MKNAEANILLLLTKYVFDDIINIKIFHPDLDFSSSDAFDET